MYKMKRRLNMPDIPAIDLRSLKSVNLLRVVQDGVITPDEFFGGLSLDEQKRLTDAICGEVDFEQPVHVNSEFNELNADEQELLLNTVVDEWNQSALKQSRTIRNPRYYNIDKSVNIPKKNIFKRVWTWFRRLFTPQWKVNEEIITENKQRYPEAAKLYEAAQMRQEELLKERRNTEHYNELDNEEYYYELNNCQQLKEDCEDKLAEGIVITPNLFFSLSYRDRNFIYSGKRAIKDKPSGMSDIQYHKLVDEIRGFKMEMRFCE